MSQECGNITETSLGQTNIDLAYDFAAASPSPSQLDHEGFTYPNFYEGYNVWSLRQQKQLADGLSQTRQQITESFNSPDSIFAHQALLDLWEDRPVAPPDELTEFRGRNVLRAILQADDRQLLHFLGWNRASLQPSSTALAVRFEDFSQSFMVDMEDMIGAGQVPPEALGALALSYQKDRTFYAIDAFTSTRFSCIGMTQEDKTGIAEHLVLDNSQELNDVCSHEMLHGVEFSTGCLFDEKLATPDSGSNVWAREAFIEHVVQTAAMTVDWEHPDIIEDEDVALYVDERKLLGTVLKAGDIPMRCFADTFMGASDRRLPELITDGFKGFYLEHQPNLLAAVSYEYNQAANRSQKRAILQGWRRQLQRA